MRELGAAESAYEGFAKSISRGVDGAAVQQAATELEEDGEGVG
jgi:hypothetical protein